MNTTESSMNSADEPVAAAASSDQGGAGWSWAAKLAFMFTGVVLPIAFRLFFPEMRHSRPGESGYLGDYGEALLSEASAPLFPFLLYSITCMTLLVFAPGRFSKNFVVRFGVYTGVLVALQYWVAFLFTSTWFVPFVFQSTWFVRFYGRWASTIFTALLSLLAVFLPWLVGWGLVLLVRKYGNIVFLPVGAAAALLWAIIGSLFVGGTLFGPAWAFLVFPLLLLYLICLLCSTPWAVASYTVIAIYAARHSGVKRLQFSLAQLLWAVTWLAAYLGAWRIAVALV